jgi:hypothetical protein
LQAKRFAQGEEEIGTRPRLIQLIFRLLIGFLIIFPATGHAEESYTFDVGEIEKKPYHFGAYLEMRPMVYLLDKDAALYKLQYYADDPGNAIKELNARIQLEGTYEKGKGRLYLKTNTDLAYSSFSYGDEKSAIYEGYASYNLMESLKIQIGKRNLKWGKGYAWNPVNFFDRLKDPDDPDQSLEGNIIASMDYIRSFDGPLKTVSFTPVLFPVYEHINDAFGLNNRLNLGAKLYFLLYDTDLDLIYVADGSRTARMGMDFSRNITSSFEMHGEIAHIRDNRRQTIDAAGLIHTEISDATSALLGIRHLTTFDLTTIIEYYHNGAGFGADAMENYFRYVKKGFDTYRTTGNAAMMGVAQNLAAAGYGRPNPMEDYLYLKFSQKEPADILYFTPSIAAMVNLHDGSFSVTPELLYTGITNLELRLRAGFIRGQTDTEFGEKAADYRIEFRAGYYF